MSSSFMGALVTRKAGARSWTVENGFEYHVGYLGSPIRIVVPAGTETDGCSIPRFLWSLWPPFGGRYDQAAVLHDYLYRTYFHMISRRIADAIFDEAMKVLEVGWFSRRCIYYGVRVGGWWTYRQYNLERERSRKGQL